MQIKSVLRSIRQNEYARLGRGISIWNAKAFGLLVRLGFVEVYRSSDPERQKVDYGKTELHPWDLSPRLTRFGLWILGT